MDVSTCLIEHNDGTKTLNTSGIVLDQKWAIFPASHFLINLSEVPEYLLEIPSGELCYKNYFKINTQNTKIFTKPNSWKHAKFFACFSCKNLRNTKNFALVPHDLDNYKQITFMLSLFIVVSLDSENLDPDNFLELVKKLLGNSVAVVRGSNIFVESTPFGSKDLICTTTKGIVANIFGENDSYFLIDAATAPGSEGGAIFLDQNQYRYIKVRVS